MKLSYSVRQLAAGVVGLLLAAHAWGEVRVTGTDLLGVEFSKALYEFAAGRELRLVLALDGSRPGLAELRAGRADLALLVVPPGEELPRGFEALPLAYQRVVVLVPTTMPLASVTLGQLESIFCGARRAGFTRWGELGLTGDWVHRVIEAHAPAVGTGLAVELFRQVAMRGDELNSSVRRYRALDELRARFAGDSRGIAVAPGPLLSAPGLKMVPVAAREREPAFLSSPENLHSGDYPLSLPLWLVFRRESAPALRDLVRFLWSDEAVPHLERAQVVPLPPAARRRQLLALERL